MDILDRVTRADRSTRYVLLDETREHSCRSSLAFFIVVLVIGVLSPSRSWTQSSESEPSFSSLKDPATAAGILPYLKMACTAYVNCTQGNLTGTGYKLDASLGNSPGDWRAAMRRSGASERIISLYERAGFSAAIFRNDEKKEIVFSLRGTDEKLPSPFKPMDILRWQAPGDWETNKDARASAIAE